MAEIHNTSNNNELLYLILVSNYHLQNSRLIRLPKNAILNIKQYMCQNYVDLVKNGFSLEYVNKIFQTDAVCLAAVECDPYQFLWVVDQTPNLCIAAINIDPSVLFYIRNQTPELCFMAINIDGDSIQDVRKPTRDMCIAAVKKSENALSYIMDQCFDVCCISIEYNIKSMKHIRNPLAHEFYKEIVKYDYEIIPYLDDKYRTYDLYLTAVSYHGLALKYIPLEDHLIYWTAVSQNGLALQYIYNQTPELCIQAVKQNKNAIMYVKNLTPEIKEIVHPPLFDIKKITVFLILIANHHLKNSIIGKKIPQPIIKIIHSHFCLDFMLYNIFYDKIFKTDCVIKYDSLDTLSLFNQHKVQSELNKYKVQYDWVNFEFIIDKSPELCMMAVKICGLNLKFIDKQTTELCIEALKNTNGYAIVYVKNQTPEICKFAVNLNWNMLQYIDDQTNDICMEAIKQNIDAVIHIRNPSDDLCILMIKYNWQIFKLLEYPSHKVCSVVSSFNKFVTKYTPNCTYVWFDQIDKNNRKHKIHLYESNKKIFNKYTKLSYKHKKPFVKYPYNF